MSAGQHINKATFLNGYLCATRGWFAHNRQHATPPSEADLLRMEEGIEIGRRVQQLFPGVLIPLQDSSAAAKQTARFMADGMYAVIFEATFVAAPYVAKADVLCREKEGWHLIEVKSSTNARPDLVVDLAYTAMVAKRAGVKIIRASLLLLSAKYQLGMDNGKLFARYECTDDVFKVVGELEKELDSVAKSALSEKRPDPNLIFACRKCEYFSTRCLGKDVKDHIFELPRLNESAFERLVNLNVTTIHEIPEVFRLTDNQVRVRLAAVTGRPVASKKELAAYLNSVDWPAFYLDFETVKSAIPLFPGTTPYEQILTQYSIHVCDAHGNETAHREFLADPSRDCRRELAERLLNDLDGTGHIVVYSSFEKTMLNNLGRLFADLKPALDKCVGRLFDLEKAFRSWFYHPEFRGRTSIKVTLPALVDLSYDGLTIADGDTAVAKYARMASGEITGDAAREVRQALLEYCKRDTLAMVRLHERLLRSCR